MIPQKKRHLYIVASNPSAKSAVFSVNTQYIVPKNIL